MNLDVLPVSAQNVDEMFTGDVARDLHATDKISSRTRWRRTRSGRGWSKKNAVVAFKNVLAQLLPRIRFSKDVFREALGAIAAVGLLDDLEYQFSHTP